MVSASDYRVRELRISYHPVPASAGGSGSPAGRLVLSTARAACALFAPRLQFESVEVFEVAFLDTKHQLIAIQTVGRGSLDTCIVHPREVFKAALLANASGIITVHNHPSGVAIPSADDLMLWNRLITAGDLLGVDVCDHLIIGEGTYWSHSEHQKGITP